MSLAFIDDSLSAEKRTETSSADRNYERGRKLRVLVSDSLFKLDSDRYYDLSQIAHLSKSYEKLEEQVEGNPERNTLALKDQFYEKLEELIKHPVDVQRKYERKRKEFSQSVRMRGMDVYKFGSLGEKTEFRDYIQLEILKAQEELRQADKVIVGSFDCRYKSWKANELEADYLKSLESLKKDLLSYVAFLGGYKSNLDEKIEKETKKSQGFLGRLKSFFRR